MWTHYYYAILIFRVCLRQFFSSYLSTITASQMEQALQCCRNKWHTHTHRIKISTVRNELKQQKLTDIFISNSNRKQKSSMPSDERFILARWLILWIAKDLLPLPMVEYRGFNDFWVSHHLSIPLPSRPTVAIAALDDMYDCLSINKICTNGGKKNHLFNHILSGRFFMLWILFYIIVFSPVHCAMTFDSYCDKVHHRAYNTYTFHQVDDDWNLKSRVLKTSLSDSPHTA